MSRTSKNNNGESLPKWKKDIYIVIFGVDTPRGKFFDVALLVLIVLSVLAVMLESVPSISENFQKELYIFEWIFTVIFTLEYIARLLVVKNRMKYATSFFGIVDLISILPTYLSLFVSGAQMLLIIRSIRLLRVFRVFKLVQFLGEAGQLGAAMKASRAKITVFIGGVFILVVVLGSLMYMIEGGDNGFTSIPRSIYWAIVTLTTVGYGDIAPTTVIGQIVASGIMILGYGIIAVPTGIVTSEMASARLAKEEQPKTCPECNASNDDDSKFCKMCGSHLESFNSD